MKLRRIFPLISAAIVAAAAATSCTDETSPIGSSIDHGSVDVAVDSVFDDLSFTSVEVSTIDSRTTAALLGRLYAPDFGELYSSYVARMLSSSSCPIPDSIGVDRVDSIRMVLTIPRGALTGDSLAPQQLKVFRLAKQLPDDIDNTFDPTGYYDPSAPIGIKNYTLSQIASKDSLFQIKDRPVSVYVTLPTQWAKDAYEEYKTNPQLFSWPQIFNKHFPGIYIQPSFGRGCMASISRVGVYVYYHYRYLQYYLEDSESKLREINLPDSAMMFATAPETLSSNNIRFTPAPSVRDLAQKSPVIAGPAGYNVAVRLPLQEAMRKFRTANYDQATVNTLTLTIPVHTPASSYGIGAPPNLLLIRKDKVEEFFANNKLPDDKTSFYAGYNPESGTYTFYGLRATLADHILNGTTPTAEEEEYVLIPVEITTDTVYEITYVRTCEPYLAKPVLMQILTDKVQLRLTYSSQLIFG